MVKMDKETGKVEKLLTARKKRGWRRKTKITADYTRTA